jgi:phosphoglycerate dehydrogenase-like enzyme
MRIILPAIARPLVEPRLPAGHDVAWFATLEEALALAPSADIGWLDLQPLPAWRQAVQAAAKLQWLSTIYAGVDVLDFAALRARGTIVTNGTGINAVAVAEYAVMGMLAAAKRYDEVVRLADRHAWPRDAPGKVELAGSSALIVGMGTIGRLIATRLAAFDVTVTGVTRSGRDGTLRPDQWRDRLGEYDWLILAAPSTDDTKALVGTAELAAMKPSAWLVNIARGDMVDQDALVAALTSGTIAGAFLDTVAPEPLPPEHPLWSAPNALHSMHLSGRSQTSMFQRGAALFLANLDAFLAGGEMTNVVDTKAGY